ncbi:LINE-1 retrotransposable element ORF1 protein, partial [Plecturocebus cupreus]
MKQEDKIREKRVKRNEQNLQEIWDYVKRPNLCLIGIPQSDEENESKLENIFQDIIQENFPKLARHDNTQLQAIQRTPQRYSSRRPTPRHIIVKFTRIEIKEKILRAAREKGQVTHKGKPIRLTADLSVETLQARREWGISLCHPGWGAMAQSRLTANTTSWVQAILLPQPPEKLGLQVPTTMPSIFFVFVFLVETGFHHVGQVSLEFLTSGDLPVSVSQRDYRHEPLEMRFHHVVQGSLELMTSSNPPTSASQRAGIRSMSHSTRPDCFIHSHAPQ